MEFVHQFSDDRNLYLNQTGSKTFMEEISSYKWHSVLVLCDSELFWSFIYWVVLISQDEALFATIVTMWNIGYFKQCKWIWSINFGIEISWWVIVLHNIVSLIICLICNNVIKWSELVKCTSIWDIYMKVINA